MGTRKRKWRCTGIKKTCVKRVVVLLVVLNALQLLVYLLHSLGVGGGNNAPPLNFPAIVMRQVSGKPWPHLPSFTPWDLKADLDPASCEAFFGNGFTQPFRLLDPKGLFHCFYSETLRTSICEGTNMVMNPKRIKMAKGGEPLDSVIGRNEEEELPYFTSGAFQIFVPERGGRKPLFNKTLLEYLIPKGTVQEHTLHHLLEQIRTIPLNEVTCAQRVTQPAVVVTRFEYANLFHTVTDWYSAYMTSRIAKLKKRPRLIFVDGHCKSSMDDGWQAMFSGVNFARHLAGPVCFDHLIFAPLGYNTPLFKGVNQGIFCQGCSASDLEKDLQYQTARLREFGEMFTSAFNISSATSSSQEDRVVKVLFIRREDYLAHPRHIGKPESRLSNEEEVLEALNTWASRRASDELNITIVNGLFAHMSMQEQLQQVQQSSIIVGAHGAGLSHILFARPEETAVLELVSPYFVRPHFQAMSQWMGMEYHAIEMGSSEADCSEVIDRVDSILTGLLRKHVIS
ncbi:unnamed protein product [Sphagnum jensenii]|uniref:Glycosyltransferase 61 catalytic domain-containing protein n=1 Tax=Sphagnum jensenii TaxID=128206 RepID=A0ABP1ASF8_9BRYO